MDMTPRWALPLLFAGQAQKEVFHNEALVLIEALLHGRAVSADLAAPPSAPVPGQCWIVATGASGAWVGQAGKIASWTDGGWRFIAPQAGLSIDVADRGHALIHDGSAWQDASLRSDGIYVDGQKVVGARSGAITAPVGGATTDMEARSTISAILAALRAHGLIAA